MAETGRTNVRPATVISTVAFGVRMIAAPGSNVSGENRGGSGRFRTQKYTPHAVMAIPIDMIHHCAAEPRRRLIRRVFMHCTPAYSRFLRDRAILAPPPGRRSTRLDESTRDLQSDQHQRHEPHPGENHRKTGGLESRLRLDARGFE